MVPEESVQGVEAASPALPHFGKSPGREPLPGSQEKILNIRIVTSVQKKHSLNIPLTSLNTNLSLSLRLILDSRLTKPSFNLYFTPETSHTNST